MESWASTSKLYLEQDYKNACRKDAAAARRARALAGTGARARRRRRSTASCATRSPTRTSKRGLRKDTTVDGVLGRGSGDPADKALLLQQMLRAVGIAARPVWAAARSRGEIDTHLANPGWFQHVLVAAEVDRQRVYLDPSDPGLGFGFLRPDHEGMPAVLPDAKTPETVTLPVTPSDQNRRQVKLALTLGADGALGGKGRLLLAGHYAWERIGWRESSRAGARSLADMAGGILRGIQGLRHRGGGVGRRADGAPFLDDGAACRGGPGRRDEPGAERPARAGAATLRAAGLQPALAGALRLHRPRRGGARAPLAGRLGTRYAAAAGAAGHRRCREGRGQRCGDPAGAGSSTTRCSISRPGSSRPPSSTTMCRPCSRRWSRAMRRAWSWFAASLLAAAPAGAASILQKSVTIISVPTARSPSECISRYASTTSATTPSGLRLP